MIVDAPEDLCDLEAPFGEGIAACVLGFDASNCPYSQSSKQWRQFADGHAFAAETPFFELVIVD